MSESNEVELVSLVGRHVLSGLDRDAYKSTWGDEGAILRFVLDGETYEAREDPSDGYRSSLETLAKVPTPVANRFPDTPVTIRHETAGNYGGEADILVMTADNGKDVLSVGTDNCDDYYPSFVGDFTPENLPCNAKA